VDAAIEMKTMLTFALWAWMFLCTGFVLYVVYRQAHAFLFGCDCG